MKIQLILLAVLALVALGIYSVPGREASAALADDPLWVIRTFNDRLNERNVEASQSLLAQDVTFTDDADQVSVGRASMRRWLQFQVCCQAQSEISDIWFSGDTVMWISRVHSESASFSSQNAAVIRRGKIVAFTIRRSASDSWPSVEPAPDPRYVRVEWHVCPSPGERNNFFCTFRAGYGEKD
jgi:SnoaL-like protein